MERVTERLRYALNAVRRFEQAVLLYETRDIRGYYEAEADAELSQLYYLAYNLRQGLGDEVATAALAEFRAGGGAVYAEMFALYRSRLK